jgi:hypothetical protein
MMQAKSMNTYAWACESNGTLTAEQRRAIRSAIRVA